MPTSERTSNTDISPHVTVCIPTRDRGESIARTIRSVLASTYTDFDVVIVDQSATDTTQLAIQHEVSGDSHVTYIRSDTIGSSRARNICLEHARGPLVLFTDDDCEVSQAWIERIVRYFLRFPDVGQINGSVVPGPHDPQLGFIPTYQVSTLVRICGPRNKRRAGGISANVAYRREVLQAVGPFDEVLCAGGELYTYEDGDMTYRMLKAGYAVLNVPDAMVIHFGFRNWEQGRVMMRRVGVGIGAACMKHLRLMDADILPTLVYEWMRCISWNRLLRLQKRTGVARFLGFAVGLVVSFRYTTDARTRTYCPSVGLPATNAGSQELLEAR
jgi:glycosyltransferase involved in cell wall biosynthesis